MPCSMPWCDANEPHHHLTMITGPAFPCDLPPRQRRRRGVTLGWPEDKIDRFVEDPYADEFQRLGPTYDDLLPMDKLWEWIARLKADPTAPPPFTIPPTDP